MTGSSEQPTIADPSSPPTEDAWYGRAPDEVLEALEVDRSGLDSDAVRARQEANGPNRLREQEPTSARRVLFGQFASPLIAMLLGALVITLAIGHFADAIVIGLVVAVNTSIGFVQEYRAQRAVESLMSLAASGARVRRDGVTQAVDADSLVPGDIALLEQGDVVPADVRLLEAVGLRIDEAALTGESVPTDKETHAIDDVHLGPADQLNMAFMGTAITAGEGEGVVVAIGGATEVGRISEEVASGGSTKTPLQIRMDRLARWITLVILGVAIVAFGTGLLLGRSATEMLLVSVALAVSAIPEGLAIVVTVALAIGVRRMARRNALVRRLAAVETLGSTTTIISDKTGTLTQNRMTVRMVVTGSEHFVIDDPDEGGDPSLRRDGHEVDLDEHPALRETLLVGQLCSGATESTGDPMEVALLVAGQQAGLSRVDLLLRYPMRHKVPFRTEHRFMATVHDAPAAETGPLVLLKGAPEQLAEMCQHQRTADGGEEPIDREAVHRLSEALGAEGFRVLAMAAGRGEEVASAVTGTPVGLVFVGMQALVDPTRANAVDAVDRCHDAGIRVVMVTGDHRSTAAAVARQVHVELPASPATGTGVPDACTGQEIAELSDAELDEVLREVNVFARVAPDQKRRLIDRLKASGEIVAVTGDGVNDAPALQSAHLGAAMGSGSDVAKEASDMVITDDNFASVYAAVEEGRTAFSNIRMATFFLLSSGAAEVLTIMTALVLDWPLPLLPAQILWLNLVTNGIVDVAIAFEPGEAALFRRPPRPIREGVLDRRLIERLGITGVWLAAGTLGIFYWEWAIRDEGIVVARTSALTTLVLFQLVHVFNCRSEDRSVFRQHPLANKVLLVGTLVSLGTYVAAMYVPWTQELLSLEPLSAAAWTVSIAVALTVIAVNDAHKRLRPRDEHAVRPSVDHRER